MQKRILLVITVPALILIFFLSTLSYFYANKLLLKSSVNDLSVLSNSIASLGNLHYSFTFSPEDEKQSRSYRRIEKKLSYLKKDPRVSEVFLIRNFKEVVFSLNSHLTIGTQFEHYILDKEIMEKALKKGIAVTNPLLGEDNMYYQRVYSKVRLPDRLLKPGEKGSLLLVLNVSRSVFNESKKSAFRIFLITLACLALLFFASMQLSKILAGPLNKLSRKMVSFSHSKANLKNYEALSLNDQNINEIKEIARSFNLMMDAVANREERLKMMAFGVAHELKNPLAAIFLFKGLLKDIPHENAEYFNRIFTEVDKINEIVNTFLSFTREADLKFVNVNCKEAFLEAIQKSSLGLKIEEQNQVIQMDLKDDCMVLADSGKLITIFSNLIKNAFQAIQKKYEDNFLKGKIIIHLDQSTDVDYLVFSVTDNGCGMNSSQLKKAFDPFYTTKAKGTGLGLSICQKWCGDFGGEMKIKSIEGEGSQVLIKLPRVYS